MVCDAIFYNTHLKSLSQGLQKYTVLKGPFIGSLIISLHPFLNPALKMASPKVCPSLCCRVKICCSGDIFHCILLQLSAIASFLKQTVLGVECQFLETALLQRRNENPGEVEHTKYRDASGELGGYTFFLKKQVLSFLLCLAEASLLIFLALLM